MDPSPSTPGRSADLIPTVHVRALELADQLSDAATSRAAALREGSENRMTDPTPYRERRAFYPAEGPAQSEEDAKSSLPPGAELKPDDGERGDVDRAMPYRGDPSPLRMEPEPFPTSDSSDSQGDPEDQ